MANSLHDSNNVPTKTGVTSGGVITNLKIDNTTGYLLATFSEVSSVVPTVNPTRAIHDDNNVPSMIATVAAGTPAACLIDNRNGYLWASTT